MYFFFKNSSFSAFSGESRMSRKYRIGESIVCQASRTKQLFARNAAWWSSEALTGKRLSPNLGRHFSFSSTNSFLFVISTDFVFSSSESPCLLTLFFFTVTAESTYRAHSIAYCFQYACRLYRVICFPPL